MRRDVGIDDIILGISSLRNPKIAAIFFRLKYIESYGTGIPRIMGAYYNEAVKPLFEASTNVFKVTLPSLKQSDSISSDAKKVLE